MDLDRGSITSVVSRISGRGLVLGAQYPKNMGILLRGLPELSFGLALGRNDENWLGECHSKRFCFGFTPIHSLSSEIQPFYLRRPFATSAAQMPLRI